MKPMPHAHDHCNHLPAEACSADHDSAPRLVPPPLRTNPSLVVPPALCEHANTMLLFRCLYQFDFSPEVGLGAFWYEVPH